jgi:hypothetical protein
MEGELLNQFDSAVIAMKETGVQNGGISHSCNHISHTAGGFKWSFTKIDTVTDA